MDEYVGQLQEGVQRFLPIVLLGPGIVLVIAGLFMWLGGLRWLKAIAAFTAATAGLIGAWIFTERQIVPMVLFPVILAGLGMVLNKLIVVLLGAAILAAAVFIGPAMADLRYERSPANQPASVDEKPLDLMESIRGIEERINRAKETVQEMIANVPQSRKSMAVVAAIAFVGMGIFSWRFACALTCSTIGTVEIFAGMTVLLLYKGIETLRQTAQRGMFFVAVAAAMILLGTALQMWLCPAKQKKKDIAKELLNEENKK